MTAPVLPAGQAYKSLDIADVIALVSSDEIDAAAKRVDRLLTDQTVNRGPMNMVAFD